MPNCIPLCLNPKFRKVYRFLVHDIGTQVRTIPTPNLLIKLQLGLMGAEWNGVPHRESKPSAQRQRSVRIARTIQQINGAMDFCG